MNITSIPLFDLLKNARHVLIAGAGGGFDVFAGLPLYAALKNLGKQVHLANLSFSTLLPSAPGYLTPHLLEVTPDTPGNSHYFPERYLSQFLSNTYNTTVPVYAFYKTGVKPLHAAYHTLCTHLDIDAIILVDGGTDSLMRGDEPDLGTPMEDACSLAAVSMLEHIPHKVLTCLGFGVDTYHGVQHHYFLESMAALIKSGHYLGTFSCMKEMPEAQLYTQALDFVHQQMPDRPSIVHLSVQSALEGDFGDVHTTSRTAGSELYINPLMSLYFSFHLEGVANRLIYLDEFFKTTATAHEVMFMIDGFRSSIAKKIREKRYIPL